MTDKNLERIRLDIERYAHGKSDSIDGSIFLNHGTDVLNMLVDYMVKELPINVMEKFEGLFKEALKGIFSGPYTADTAREVILAQERLGFVLKYKSYAVKASSPLGYSVFIQERGEGFSFQRHRVHKTEIFHILDVQENGYVFICDYKDWEKHYEEKPFARWLAGKPDQRYEQFRIFPQPGDVFAIDKLDIVHTVIGCVLEEYATVSTDMVDRLYDQNAGKEIPVFLNRKYSQKRLKEMEFPAHSRHVDMSTGKRSVIEPETVPGGTRVTLCRDRFYAYRYCFEPSKASVLMYDGDYASSIYITRGSGRLIVGDKEEVNRFTPPSLPISSGHLLLIPNGMYYRFIGEGTIPLELSEQKIPLEVALI